MSIAEQLEQIGLERGLERGREEGQSEARRVIACKALAEGLPLTTVMAITGLSHADLLALQSEGLTRH